MFYSRKKRNFLILKPQWFQKKKINKLANSAFRLLLKSKRHRFKTKYRRYYRRLKFRSRLFLYRYIRVVFLKMYLTFKFFKVKKKSATSKLNLNKYIKWIYSLYDLTSLDLLSLPINQKRLYYKYKKSFKRVFGFLGRPKLKKSVVVQNHLDHKRFAKKKNFKNLNYKPFNRKKKPVNDNKNMHKPFYNEKPFLKRERWPRKLKKLLAKWRFKKVNNKNKVTWLKFQKKKIFKYYNILKKKKKNIKRRVEKRFFIYKNFKRFLNKYRRRRFFNKRKKKKWARIKFKLLLKRKKFRIRWGFLRNNNKFYKPLDFKYLTRFNLHFKYLRRQNNIHSSVSYFLYGKRRRKNRNKFWYDFHSVYKRKKKRKLIERVSETYKKLILFFVGLNSSVSIKKYTFLKNLSYKNLLLNLGFNLIFTLRASNFLNNFYYSKHFIKREGVLVNGVVQVLPNFVLKKWDIISIHLKYRYLVFLNLLKKFQNRKTFRFSNKHQVFHIQKMANLFYKKKKSKKYLFKLKKKWYSSKFSKKLYWYDFKKNLQSKINSPKFMEVNYKLLMIILISKPKMRDLNLPFESYIKKHKGKGRYWK